MTITNNNQNTLEIVLYCKNIYITMSNPSSNSKIYLGRKVFISTAGDLNLQDANLVSSSLGSQISNAVSTEVARATVAEKALNVRIDILSSASTSAIASAVSAEQVRASGVESNLQSDINAQTGRIDAILAGSTVSSDTLAEVMAFAQSVKDLEIGDVTGLTTAVGANTTNISSNTANIAMLLSRLDALYQFFLQTDSSVAPQSNQ